MFDVDLASVKAYHHHLNLAYHHHLNRLTLSRRIVRPILRFMYMFVVTEERALDRTFCS